MRALLRFGLNALTPLRETEAAAGWWQIVISVVVAIAPSSSRLFAPDIPVGGWRGAAMWGLGVLVVLFACEGMRLTRRLHLMLEPRVTFSEPIPLRSQGIDFMFERPNMRGEMMVQTRHQAADLYRVAVTNQGPETRVSVRLDALEPAAQAPIRPHLHVTNDNPPDHKTYREEATLNRGETETFDVVCMTPPADKRPGTVFVAATSQVGHYVPTAIDGTYELTIAAYGLMAPTSARYHLRASPATGAFEMSGPLG